MMQRDKKNLPSLSESSMTTMLDSTNLVLATGSRTTKNINSNQHSQQYTSNTVTTAGTKKSLGNSLTMRLQNSASLLTQQSSASIDGTTVLGKRSNNNGVLRHAVTGTVGVLPSNKRGLSKRMSTAGDISRTSTTNQRRPSGMQSSQTSKALTRALTDENQESGLRKPSGAGSTYPAKSSSVNSYENNGKLTKRQKIASYEDSAFLATKVGGKTVTTASAAKKVAVLYSETDGKAAMKDLPRVVADVSDTDSDGMDCLVANETLHLSDTEFSRRKSPEIRRITKRASFITNESTNFNRKKINVGSFSSRQQINSKKSMQMTKAPEQRRGTTLRHKESKLLQDRTNTNGLVSHNSSPVQDEMTVNMAISRGVKVNTAANKAITLVSRTVPKSTDANVSKRKRCKENRQEYATVSAIQISDSQNQIFDSEQDKTVVVSGAAITLSDQAFLKASQSQVQAPDTAAMPDTCEQPSILSETMQEAPSMPQTATHAPHGRNFSVNLPYASKQTLHTNMGSLQVSRKASHNNITVVPKPPRLTTTNRLPQSSEAGARSIQCQEPAILDSSQSLNEAALKVYGQPASADCAIVSGGLLGYGVTQAARPINHAGYKDVSDQSLLTSEAAATIQNQRVDHKLICGTSNTEQVDNILIVGQQDQSTSSLLLEADSSEAARIAASMAEPKFYYLEPDMPPQPEDSINFYEIDCPENISEEEEVQLGLGELLEEHRAHFFMEKLSGNFSTSEVQSSSLQSQGRQSFQPLDKEMTQSQQDRLLMDESQPAEHSDMHMQSSGAMSSSLTQGGIGQNNNLSHQSVLMRSSNENSQEEAAGEWNDRKMKSSEGFLTCSAEGEALLHSQNQEENSELHCPKVQANIRHDFAAEIKDELIVDLHAPQEGRLNAAIAANDASSCVLQSTPKVISSDGLSNQLHADAERDMQMIQEQLRQYNDVSITERQSILRDHLETSSSRLDQSQLLREGELAKPHTQSNVSSTVNEMALVQERLDDLHLQVDGFEHDMGKIIKIEQRNLEQSKALLEPAIKVEEFSDQDQESEGSHTLYDLQNGEETKACHGTSNLHHIQSIEISEDVQDVRFETTQKHSRAVTKRIGRHQNQHSSLVYPQVGQLLPPPTFEPLTKRQLADQKQGFEQAFHDKMMRKEFDSRLSQDFFKWQTKIDKLMRVTLMCWMAELCSDMRFQKTTFYMSLAYVDKFFESVPYQYGPDELQLIGVTSVFIAAKVEEVFVQTVKVFSKSTNYSSSVKRICQMEREMMQVLGFRLHPVTLISWADFYTRMWDDYADANNLHALTEVHDAAFRQFTLHSYNRYRSFMTYLDAIAIDYRAHEFEPRKLVAALLYLVIGNQNTMAVFPNYYQMAVQFIVNPPIPDVEDTSAEVDGQGKDDQNLKDQERRKGVSTDCFVTPATNSQRRKQVLIGQTASSSSKKCDQQQQQSLDPQIVYYNDKVFSPFLKANFNMNLHQIRDTVMYVAKFLALNLELDPPDCSNLGEDPEDVKIEEYIGLQTANSNMLNYLDWIVKHEEQQRRQQELVHRNANQPQQSNKTRSSKVERMKSGGTRGRSDGQSQAYHHNHHQQV